MRRHLFLLLAALAVLPLKAQENTTGRLPGNNKLTATPRPLTTYAEDDGFLATPLHDGEPIPAATPATPRQEAAPDTVRTLHLPAVNQNGQVQPAARYPYSWWGGYQTWDLHPGLNVSLGASVMTTFGRGGLSGAGFAQNLSMMYAVPLSNKLSLAVGGWLNNMDWGRYSCRQAGISAVLGYKFDEHWEGYIYAQKSLVGKTSALPYPLYDLGHNGDRIGAAVRYNFSPSFSIQINVEGSRQPVYRGFHTWDNMPPEGGFQ